MIPTNIMQFLSKMNLNIQNMQNINSPDDLAQMLLNSGKVKQAQVNQAKQMWNNQPNIRQMIFNKYGF